MALCRIFGGRCLDAVRGRAYGVTALPTSWSSAGVDCEGDGVGSRKLGQRTPEASVPGDAALDWDDVYRRYAPDLRRLIAARIPAGGAVDDVLQETFVRAFKSRHRFDPACPQWPWLATLAHRSCVKWWRTHRPAELLVDHESADGVGLALAPGSDDHLLRLDRSRAVAEALAQLTPRHRRVLYLHGAEDLPYDRLAEGEAISHKALKSLLGRARVHFRRHYVRLSEESAVALSLTRGVLVRLRSRLSGREATAWERVGSLAGAAFAAGIVGVLTVPGSVPLATAGAGGVVTVRPVGTAPTSTASSTATDGATATPSGVGTSREQVDRIARPPTQPGPRAADGTVQVPIGVATGRGITHGDDDSTMRLSVMVDHPIGLGTTSFGTEVRCDAGKLYTLECAVLRMLPPTD